jgi:hypothetical protein
MTSRFRATSCDSPAMRRGSMRCGNITCISQRPGLTIARDARVPAYHSCDTHTSCGIGLLRGFQFRQGESRVRFAPMLAEEVGRLPPGMRLHRAAGSADLNLLAGVRWRPYRSGGRRLPHSSARRVGRSLSTARRLCQGKATLSSDCHTRCRNAQCSWGG